MSVQIKISYFITGRVSQLSIWDILSGGPPIPIVGGSVFYFLSDLIILTILSFIYIKIPDRAKIVTAWLILVVFLGYFEITNHHNQQIYPFPFQFCLEFIVYIPVAFYFFKAKNYLLRWKIYYLFAYIVFSLQDCYFRLYLSYEHSVYSRASIFVGTLLFICTVYSWEPKQSSSLQLLGKYSLGIFAVHKYCQYVFILLIKRPEFSSLHLHFFGGTLALVPVAISLMTVAFTFISVYLLKLAGLKNFVS